MITPSTLTVTLQPGESVSEDKVVSLPELPPMADVIFAFDLTGSMGGVIATAKASATELIAALDALGIDINYGVMSYMDYPHCYTDYCGYTACYGVPGDYPYRLDQAVTANRAAVEAAINSLVLGSGADGPQDYTRPFYESYADPNVNWRPGAKRILINFADNVPHDCNLNEGVPGHEADPPWSTGGDPGRDEIQDTPDDLDLQPVLAEMAANNITLLEAHATSFALEYWAYWTGITGGQVFQLNTADFVDQVVAAILATLTTSSVEDLHLEAGPGYESWLTGVVPPSYSGPTDVNVPFAITITVPPGTAPGVYTFTIAAIDSGGVSYGEQTVTITVGATEIRRRGIEW